MNLGMAADAKQSTMKLSLESITLGTNSSLQKSPTRSPMKANRQLPALSIDTGKHLDVDDAPDSTHANDQQGQRSSPTKQQRSTKAPAQAASDGLAAGDDTSRKYIQLLNIASATGMIHGKSKLPSGTNAAQQSAVSSSAGAGAADPAAPRASTVSSAVASKAVPLSRVPRSRASILDASPGPSLIPTSSAVEKAPQVPSPDRSYHGSRTASSSISSSVVQCSPSRRPDCRTGAKSTDVAASPARRSLGPSSCAAAAVPRPQYAFGSRIDSAAAAARKPSPMRQSAPSPVRQHTSTASDRSRASPQRVPAAAKSAAAATASLRSASAPRMAAADKAQSRFAQHQASAAAALRSKTPNPARASGVSAVGPAGSSAAARLRPGGGVLSSSVASSTAQSKHSSRTRASDVGASRLTGGGNPVAARSASPVSRAAAGRASVEGQPRPAALRGFARSVPTAAGPTGSKAAAVGTGGSPNKPKPVAPAGQRAAGPRAERVSALAAAAGTSSKMTSVSTVGIPTLQDRYKTGHKHTPAALAVAEARGAAASQGDATVASNSSAATVIVPKLLLGSLLKSPATPSMLRTRQGEQGGSNIPANLPGTPTAEHGSSSSASPFLGRISAATSAGATPGAEQKQQRLQHTQQSQQKLQRRSLPLQPGASSAASLTLIPPSPAATSSAASVVEGRASSPLAIDGEHMSPPLLPRELSGASTVVEAVLPTEVVGEFGRQHSSQVPCLSLEGSIATVDSTAVAVAAKGLVQLPLHRLNEEDAAGQVASPPRHRRGERSSPKGAAAVCSQLLKSKASSVCSSSKTLAEPEAATPYTATPAAAAATEAAAGTSNCAAAHDYATPVADSTSKTLSFSPGMQSSDIKLRGLVPRLDLTPVLAQAEEDQLEEQQQQEQDLQQPQLEHPELLLLEHNVQQEVRGQTRSGAHDGKPASAAKRGASAGCRPASGSGKRNSAPAEVPPQESFYVYESVIPAEETRTYDELRRALLKCHNGHRLAASLQGIWGCYQDARRNTEAMAFRGHRLLDQVSNEYCAYKREAEQQLTQLQQECQAYKDDLQLALSGARAGSRDVELTAKDKQVRELQHENQQLRLQMVEMEKALQKAADYHQAQQADQVPVKARAIAESATTSILFKQTVAQQEELLKSQKMLEDMKAALMIACGTLKQTNYMDLQGPVRAALQHDTIQVLDMMISSTQMEASMLDQAAGSAAHIVQPHVEIEELH